MARNEHITSDDHALRILDAATDVDDEGDDGETVDEATIARLRAAAEASLARAWARVHADARAEVDAHAVRSARDLVGWTRAQLLERLDALRRLFGPQLQLAHRKLEAMPDDDLRSLIADLEDGAATLPREPS